MGKISISREIAAVRRSLSTLDKALTRLASQAGKAGREAVKSAARPARKIKLSPARRKALQLHGRYMGYVRQHAQPLWARTLEWFDGLGR